MNTELGIAIIWIGIAVLAIGAFLIYIGIQEILA